MKKSKKGLSLWERYLTREISIEFKACLYFFAILFYYCIYRLCSAITVAEILHMAEMILLTYAMGYLQVYALWNFDEADSIGKKELLGVLVCTGIYTASSYFFNWFQKSIPVTLGFSAYILFLYFCVYLVYKTRRHMDEKILNDNLNLFKTRKKVE